jgi:hypothetical protein
MALRLALLVPVALLLAGCQTREIERELAIIDVHTGWYDVGTTQAGQNKLVPSISFKFQNVSDDDIASVQVNAVFRREGEEESWGEHFVNGIDSNGLSAGGLGTPLVLRSTLGYTGTQSRLEMLQNREFVDAKVEIYGKHGRRGWVKLGEYQIDRQLLSE